MYLIVNDIGTNSGEDPDFINGYTFAERFYTVFVTANERVGFGGDGTDACYYELVVEWKS